MHQKSVEAQVFKCWLCVLMTLRNWRTFAAQCNKWYRGGLLHFQPISDVKFSKPLLFILSYLPFALWVFVYIFLIVWSLKLHSNWGITGLSSKIDTETQKSWGCKGPLEVFLITSLLKQGHLEPPRASYPSQMKINLSKKKKKPFLT